MEEFVTTLLAVLIGTALAGALLFIIGGAMGAGW
jgi:hypothetical protein